MKRMALACGLVTLAALTAPAQQVQQSAATTHQSAQYDSPQRLAKQLDDEGTDDRRQAWLNWVHFTAPGRKAVAAMLRKAGATR